jgi:hypothetical protein
VRKRIEAMAALVACLTWVPIVVSRWWAVPCLLALGVLGVSCLTGREVA